MATQVSPMATLRFDNQNLQRLPVDESRLPGTRSVPDAIFSLVDLTPVRGPLRLVAASGPAMALLGLRLDARADADADASPEGGAGEGCVEDRIEAQPNLLEALAGNVVLPGSVPAAHCYAGHQFGSFAGQLGDGAAMYLGEVVNEAGERWELQLKGAGPTPFSRHADGRKVLRSSLREFLASEAAHALHIPSTRAGSLLASQSRVARDPLYSGDVKQEICAVILRIAPNFFRFGSFEIFKGAEKGSTTEHRGPTGPSAGNEGLKRQLLNHIVSSYFQRDIPDANSDTAYETFFRIVTTNTAQLVARWQAYGFVHGVLNTDNMSIMGVTIDYGPYAFMEYFDFDLVPNGSDGSARYTYGAQPEICKWNLFKLAEALDPLLPLSKSQEIIELVYQSSYFSEYMDLMRKRLGLLSEQSGDVELFESLVKVLNETSCDYNDFFRALTLWAAEDFSAAGQSPPDGISSSRERAASRILSRCATPRVVEGECLKKLRILKRPSAPPQRIYALLEALKADPAQICASFGGVDVEDLEEELMNEFQLCKVLEAATKKLKLARSSSLEEKVKLDEAAWKGWLDEFCARLLLDQDAAADRTEWLRIRAETMSRSNPTFILRNWVAQICIDAAESGDNSKDPFNPAYCSFTSDLPSQCSADATPGAELEFIVPRPLWAASLMCTCSS